MAHHPTQHVVLFNNGIVHTRLHEALQVSLRRLLKRLFEVKTERNKKPEHFEWFDFSVSCRCGQKEQKFWMQPTTLAEDLLTMCEETPSSPISTF